VRASLFVAAIAGLAACAPTIDGPADHQRAIDRDDADRLAAQLAVLPGAVRATVALHRPLRDPLATPQQLPPPTLAAVIVVDDGADRGAVTAAATHLARAAAPEVDAPNIAIELGAERPVLARVGPFVVAARDRGALVATLATAAALVALLAGWIAWRERWRVQRERGSSTQ
jgi:hypothetical protein